MVSEPGTSAVGLGPRAVSAPRDDIDAVIERELPRLLALAYSVLHDRDGAYDIVQDTVERALRSWPSIRDRGRISAWLSTVCVRQALRRLRAQRRSQLLPWSSGDGQVAQVSSGDIDLERALHAHLSARQRAIVALHYIYGYTLDESAVALGCRPGTVRSHLNRALRKLREELER